MRRILPLILLIGTMGACAPAPTPTPTRTPLPTDTAVPSQTPSPTATPKPAWQTTMEVQDPKDTYFKIVDGKPTIDLYDTAQLAESIALVQESIRVMETNDSLNLNILTAKDADGNTYAFNPDHGWFMLPEVQMDYTKLDEYTPVTQAFIEDGRANLTTALRYAENPTISPDAIDPVYWVNYWYTDTRGGDTILMLCNNACGKGGYAYRDYREEIEKMGFNNSAFMPFAWTGFYKAQLENGNSVYVVGRTLKNPSAINPNQTINLFYGFDQSTYERLAVKDAGTSSPLKRFFEQTNTGFYDFVTILPPPTTINGVPVSFTLGPDGWITQGCPIIAGLQQRGELISEFDPINQQITMQVLQAGGDPYLSIAPLTQPLPAGLSKHILLSGFMNK